MTKKAGPKIDHDAALKHALQAYKKRSTQAAAEVAALQLRRGWRIAARYAAEQLQRIDLGLKEHELPPCRLRRRTVGSLTDVWLVDPRGRDQRRPEMAMLFRQLTYFGLSRFEPNPLAAIELERARRRAPPPGTAA